VSSHADSEGLGLNPEDDLSAVGAALNPATLAPVSFRANSGFPRSGSTNVVTLKGSPI
jgi:hypothetical protein